MEIDNDVREQCIQLEVSSPSRVDGNSTLC